MREYVIITDSSADLNENLYREMGVEVLPLSFLIRGTSLKNYADNRDMAPEEFYRLIRGGEMPTTNAVNAQQYVDLLSPILSGGRDALILSFTSGLSATYQSSVMACEELRAMFPDRTVETVDTACASCGQGLLVWHAANLKKEGKSLEEVRAWCEANKLKIAHWFTVDDLMHLKRGGRVSAATAVVGSMLQIKPVLHVDYEGHLISVSKARGRKASLDALVRKVVDTAIEPEKQTIFIDHSDCLGDAQYVADQIRRNCGTEKFEINFIGPVIGSHTGCGCVLVCFMATER